MIKNHEIMYSLKSYNYVKYIYFFIFICNFIHRDTIKCLLLGYLQPTRHSTAPSRLWLDWCGRERPWFLLKEEGGRESGQHHTFELNPAPGNEQSWSHSGWSCLDAEMEKKRHLTATNRSLKFIMLDLNFTSQQCTFHNLPYLDISLWVASRAVV